jgi:sec-independent protein translocase protein TatB
MFDIGFSELVVIALVALIVLGPKRLPEVARTAGQWLARFRRFVSDVKQDFDRELQHADLAELQKLKQELDETRRVVEETSSRLVQQATIEPPAPSKAPEPAMASAPAVVPPLAGLPPSAPAKVKRRSSRSSKKAAATKKRTAAKGKHGRSG